MDDLMRDLQVLWKADSLIGRIWLNVLARRLAHFAALIAVFGLGMANVAGFMGLQAACGPVWSAAIVAVVDPGAHLLGLESRAAQPEQVAAAAVGAPEHHGDRGRPAGRRHAVRRPSQRPEDIGEGRRRADPFGVFEGRQGSLPRTDALASPVAAHRANVRREFGRQILIGRRRREAPPQASPRHSDCSLLAQQPRCVASMPSKPTREEPVPPKPRQLGQRRRFILTRLRSSSTPAQPLR